MRRALRATKLRALVIESEQAARDSLVALLKISDVVVTGATAILEEGRYELGSNTPDLVFVDIELVRSASLRTQIMLGHPRPTFVATTTDPTHGLDAHDLGVADYLLKPFTSDRVSLCVGRVGGRVRAGHLLRSSDLRTFRTRPVG